MPVQLLLKEVDPGRRVEGEEFLPQRNGELRIHIGKGYEDVNHLSVQPGRHLGATCRARSCRSQGIVVERRSGR